MQHIAAEGRCWVLGSGCALRAADIPASFPGRAEMFPDPDEWINPGDSVVVAPGGEIIAGPLARGAGAAFREHRARRAPPLLGARSM